jgi:hypothetical protein
VAGGGFAEVLGVVDRSLGVVEGFLGAVEGFEGPEDCTISSK